MRDQQRTHPQATRQKSCERIGGQVHHKLLEATVRQRHDIALQPVDLHRLQYEEVPDRGLPFGGLVVAGDGAIRAALAYMMQAAELAPLSLKYGPQKTRYVVVPPG